MGPLRARSAAPGGPQGDLEDQNCLPVLHAPSKRVTVPADCQETSEQSELPGKRYESRVVSFASLRCGSATVGRVGGEWPLMGIRSTDADRRQQELHSARLDL
jgi:hypothetical protein